MNKKILIIGSEGFIGKNAVAFFSRIGYNVFGADILDNSKRNYFKVGEESTCFNSIFSEDKFNICINVSGAANVSKSITEPYFDFNLNVVNVVKILEAIRLYNPDCKFINFSSAAVYGNPTILPIKEDSLISPISPYGFHKFYSENILKEYNEIFKIQTLSLRVFSVYGEGLRKQLFWDLFNKFQNVSKNEVVLSGNGSESRDFIYIQDLLRVVILIIDNIKFEGQKINIANGEATQISEAVSLFGNLFDPNVRIRYNNEIREGDPKNWKADISVLKELGYKPDFTLKMGLQNYIKWLTND